MLRSPGIPGYLFLHSPGRTSILSHFDVGITRGVFAVIYNIFDTLEILKKLAHCDPGLYTDAIVGIFRRALHIPRYWSGSDEIVHRAIVRAHLSVHYFLAELLKVLRISRNPYCEQKSRNC